MTCERMQEILDAYLDGEIPAPDAREIEEHLHECAGCAGQLASRKALQGALRTKLAYYRLPSTVRISAAALQGEPESFSGVATQRHDASTSEPANARSIVWWRRTALSLAACFALVSTALLALLASYRHQPMPDYTWSVPQLVLSDHVRSLEGGGTLALTDAANTGHLMDVISSDRHTVRPWFAGKLPFAPAVPDLQGFALLGGRLDMVLDQPAAAIVYRRDKHLINLFIWPRARFDASLTPMPPTPHDAGGYHEVEFAFDGFSYWAVSDLETDALLQFARAYETAAKSPATSMH